MSREKQAWFDRWASWELQRRRWVAVAVAATLFILLWWLVPPLLYRHAGGTADARLKAITDTRTALLAGLVGVGALLTFWLNSRTHHLTEQGQIADRYRQGIEQLGSAKLDVRVGAIYALERIAVDSKRDHPTVVEVLSAFVREHSDPTQTLSEPTIAETIVALLQGTNEPPGVAASDEVPIVPSKPATDLQAAVTVLGRLPQRPGVSRGDLSGAYLTGSSLVGANLSRALLDKVNLSNSNLENADLSGALLREADLSNAYLLHANLSNANLYKVDLSNSNLNLTNLSKAKMYGATLHKARLPFADLRATDIGSANLIEADLDSAKLANASLMRANLTGARLGGADFSNTKLDGADVSKASFVDESIALHEAPDWEWRHEEQVAIATGLIQDQLDKANGDDDTRLPDGLRRPAHWSVLGGQN